MSDILKSVKRSARIALKGKPTARGFQGALTPLGWRLSGQQEHSDLAPEPGSFHFNDGPHYHDVLRELQQILDPEWYLEIGSRGGDSLRFARRNAVAIDPVFDLRWPPKASGTMHLMAATSDDFFTGGFLAREGIVPEFGFLDGMHLGEFLLRDFINFEACARPGAIVALHDCLPFTHDMTVRDDSATRTGAAWTGDVWKTLVWLIRHRPDLDIHVLDAHKTGLVVIENLDPANTSLAATLDAFTVEMVPTDLATFGVDRFFGSFEIENAYRFVQELKDRRAA